MKESKLLTKANSVFCKRRNAYGDPKPLFEELAKRWSIVIGKEVTASQVVQCMIELKLARLKQHPGHEDSIVDIAGYGACLAEISQ